MNPASSRLERSAFYVILAIVVIAPLVFWPSPYATLDLVKTIVIAAGTIVSAILLGIVAIKNRTVILPPNAIFRASLLVCLSLVLSAFFSGHPGKSFFGQGFETGTASFIMLLFLAGYAAFVAVRRETGRAIVLYAGLTASFLILYVFHLLRLAFGSGFASLSILNGMASTVFGNWYGLSMYALVIALISVAALLFLPLTRRFRIFYWALLVLAAAGAFVVNDVRAWGAAALVFLGLAIFASMRSVSRAHASGTKKSFRHIAWIPVIACIIAGAFAWDGAAIAGPTITRLNAGYSEVVLPWQLTLDVVSGTVKSYPLFGYGPNRFSQAYLDNKPAIVNSTDAWNYEFGSGWSTISTLIVGQGLIGAVLWLLFFVFFGIAGTRALRKLPGDPQNAFIIVSSFAAASFLWIMVLISSIQHVAFLDAFILSGVFFAAASASGSLSSCEVSPAHNGRFRKAFIPAMALLILLAIVWGLVYAKKTVALAYFSSGVKQLRTAAPGGDPLKADADFAAAQQWDPSDIYLQARAEAGISEVTAIGASVGANAPAATTQAALTKVAGILGNSLKYATSAIAFDPSNYYNYVSEARVAAAGASLNAPNAYDTAVQAYTAAINHNPSNPSLYLLLAQLQASQNKLDDALKTVGAAIQVKPNYLDAVFLLSQIEAAKGDLVNAITAAQVAVQLNAQSPILFFQLGILQYENKDYADAAQAFMAAIKLQPDYANAQYFLGLSDVRLGKTADAIAQFQSLVVSNPDNQEVEFILTNLRAGKSPFADAQPPVTPTPEKRATLPIKQK